MATHVRVELDICFFRYYRDELRVAMKAAAEVVVRFASSRDDITGCVAGMIAARYGELTRCMPREISCDATGLRAGISTTSKPAQSTSLRTVESCTVASLRTSSAFLFQELPTRVARSGPK